MIDPKEIETVISELHTFKDLIQAYEEIASLRMKKTRDTVLYNRQYLSSINEIFDEVRSSYAQQVKSLLHRRGKKADNLTFLAHNGKTVAVFLSANTGLYGEVIARTFELFMDEVKKGQVEVTIVGRHGLSLFLGQMPNHPYTYFPLSDQEVSPQDLDSIIRHIVQYEEIHVYHGQYTSVINQEAKMLSISANISKDIKSSQKPLSYLFEPSLKTILEYFETEIFGSLFSQTVQESQLAKYASRVLAMDKADVNISKELGKLKLENLRARHIQNNRKQLNILPRFMNI